MKTSNVIASLLFGAIAAAAPLDKRVLVTKTNVVVETVVVFTTVWDGEVATTAATTTSAPAAFYEVTSSRAHRTRSRRPKSSAQATSVVVAPTSVYTPPQETSTAQPTTPAPVTSSVYVAPPVPSTTEQAPVASSEAPSSTYSAAPAASATAPASNAGSGQVYSGGSMTLHPFAGALGSCGYSIANTDMAVALASELYGPSTYDVQTGAATNKWCGAKAAVSYNGQTTTVTIGDVCSGCTGNGMDFSPAAWKAVTGTDVGDRITGMTWQLIA